MEFANVTAQELEKLSKTFHTFNFYACLFILFPGLIFNIVAFVVYFTRKKLWQQTSMGLYYSTLSVISAFAVCVAIIDFFPDSFNQDLKLKSKALCQIIWLARNQAIYTSGYFSILVTLDRTVTIMYANRVRFFTRTKNVLTLTLLIVLFVAALVTPSWWRYLSISIDESNQTIVSCILDPLPNDIFLIESILARILPSVCNVSMNIIIIRKFFKSKRSVTVWSETMRRPSGSLSTRDYWFVYTLIIQNFTFFILTFPYVIASGVAIYQTFISISSDQAQFARIIQSFCVWGNYTYVSVDRILSIAMFYSFKNLFTGQSAVLL